MKFLQDTKYIALISSDYLPSLSVHRDVKIDEYGPSGILVGNMRYERYDERFGVYSNEPNGSGHFEVCLLYPDTNPPIRSWNIPPKQDLRASTEHVLYAMLRSSIKGGNVSHEDFRYMKPIFENPVYMFTKFNELDRNLIDTHAYYLKYFYGLEF